MIEISATNLKFPLFSEGYFLVKTHTFQEGVSCFLRTFKFDISPFLLQMNKSPRSNNLISRKAKTSAEFVMAAGR